jgi:hypothetical protein
MRTRIFHQLLPIAILIGAILVAAGLRRFLWHPRTKGWSSYSQEGLSKQVRRDRREPAEPAGSVVGKVLDDQNQPVYAIRVDLLPVGKATAGDDERWYARLSDWTNRDGTYKFSQLKPGEYFLSVGSQRAPTGKRPFAATYYPGTDLEKASEPIRVQGNAEIELRPLRLRRLPTHTIKIHVRWQNGTPVERSNLLFYNPSFPHDGVIGGEAPGIEDGEGEFIVPTGFEYYARAAATCDTGAQIKSEESRPVQRIGINGADIPQELTFVIPSEPCKLWNPGK